MHGSRKISANGHLPAIIVNLLYATAALNAWSPKSFIKYIRSLSRDTYYNDLDNDGQDYGNVDGGVDAQMGDQTTGRSGYNPSNLNIPAGQPRPVKERCFTDSDLMDSVSALWIKLSMKS